MNSVSIGIWILNGHLFNHNSRQKLSFQHSPIGLRYVYDWTRWDPHRVAHVKNKFPKIFYDQFINPLYMVSGNYFVQVLSTSGKLVNLPNFWFEFHFSSNSSSKLEFLNLISKNEHFWVICVNLPESCLYYEFPDTVIIIVCLFNNGFTNVGNPLLP